MWYLIIEHWKEWSLLVLQIDLLHNYIMPYIIAVLLTIMNYTLLLA